MNKVPLKKLWKDLFNDEDKYINWYFENVYSQDTVEFLIEDDILSGMIYKNKYDISVGYDNFIGKYLVAVGVSPEKRGEGVMKKLLLKIMNESYKNEEEFLYLSPIDKKIYEKFGFVYISSLLKYDLNFSFLSHMKKSTKIFKIENENYDKNILTKLESFYKKFSENYFIKVNRTKENYKLILSELFAEDGICYISYDDFGNINGSMFVLKSKDICVKEILFSSKDACESLLSILSTYQNYFNSLKIFLPSDIDLENFLINDFGLNKFSVNKFQARIICVEKTLTRLSQNLTSDEEILLKISDEYILENNGVFKMSKNSVEKISNDSEIFDIHLGIKDLTLLSLGKKDFKSFKKFENFYIKNEAVEIMLNNIFTEKINYLNQAF